IHDSLPILVHPTGRAEAKCCVRRLSARGAGVGVTRAGRSGRTHALDSCGFSAIWVVAVVATSARSSHIFWRMSYAFHTADVFTDHLYGGNPLAVIPDARG